MEVRKASSKVRSLIFLMIVYLYDSVFKDDLNVDVLGDLNAH